MLLLVQQAEREAKADALGVKVTDKDVDTRLDAIKKQYFGGSHAKYLAQLKKQNLTEAQVREDVRQQLISEQLSDKITKGVTVSAAADRCVLQGERLHVLAAGDARRALHPRRQGQGDRAVGLPAAEGRRRQGVVHAREEVREGASSQNCGKATFSKGQTVPVFDNIAFTAPANQVHAPFYDPTQYKSWFVVEPLGPVKKAATTPEKQVAASIKQQLLQQKKQQAITDWTNSLTKELLPWLQGQVRARLRPRRPIPARRDDDELDDHGVTPGMSLADALVELQELTEQLRRECPWDREQTTRTIVPHTVEEAYEVADAALAGDDASCSTRSATCSSSRTSSRCSSQERGAGDLEQVARGIHAKLVSRHPHVFGDAEARSGGARARALGAPEARAGRA